MAKRPTSKKKAPPKKAKRAAAAPKASKANGKVPHKSPRSQVLPGMNQVRDGILDRICEDIADARMTANQAKQTEAGGITSALQRMQMRNVSVYKHGGIELARIPGADKLRVRLSKEDGDAEVSGGDTTSSQDEPEPADDPDGREENPVPF